MKKFQFRLQIVLEQRKAKEDNILLDLRKLRREEALELIRLNELENTLVNAEENLSEVLSNSGDPLEMTRSDEYVRALRDDIKVQELTIEAVRGRVEEKRVELVSAMRDRQVLEALCEKQERAYLLEQQQAEQNALDEMASVRYARGM